MTQNLLNGKIKVKKITSVKIMNFMIEMYEKVNDNEEWDEEWDEEKVKEIKKHEECIMKNVFCKGEQFKFPEGHFLVTNS